jgi:hypothetical protein
VRHRADVPILWHEQPSFTSLIYMFRSAAIVGGALVGGAALGYACAVLGVRRPRPTVAKRLRNFRSTLCVVTYNVLADGMYAAVGKHKDSTHGGFNSYSTPQEREWSQRFPAIIAELDTYAVRGRHSCRLCVDAQLAVDRAPSAQPDVICLQEVQHSHYIDSFQPSLHERGYSTTLSPRGTGERDLCLMVATRDAALKVLAVECVSFARVLKELASEVPLSPALMHAARSKSEELVLTQCLHSPLHSWALSLRSVHCVWSGEELVLVLCEQRTSRPGSNGGSVLRLSTTCVRVPTCRRPDRPTARGRHHAPLVGPDDARAQARTGGAPLPRH